MSKFNVSEHNTRTRALSRRFPTVIAVTITGMFAAATASISIGSTLPL